MKMTQLTLSTFAVSCAIWMDACSQGPVNIGENNGAAQTKTGLAAYAANWVGYAEARQFMDGSDTVRVVVTEAGTGTIRFGNRDLWPPASDPNADYPPDFVAGANFPPDLVVGAAPHGCALSVVAWDGFMHPLTDVRVEQERLRASIASQEVFDSWCKIQTPIALASGGYSCVNSDLWISNFPPNCTSAIDAGPLQCGAYQWMDGAKTRYQLVSVPCNQASLCYDPSQRFADGGVTSQAVCTCTESGCQLGNVPNDIVLDAALDNAQQNMTGTLVIGATNYTIRLKRQ